MCKGRTRLQDFDVIGNPDETDVYPVSGFLYTYYFMNRLILNKRRLKR